MTTSYDNSLRIWSATEFSCTTTLAEHEAQVMGGDISSGKLWYNFNRTSFVLDGQCLVSVSFDRTFKLWTLTKQTNDDNDEDLFKPTK